MWEILCQSCTDFVAPDRIYFHRHRFVSFDDLFVKILRLEEVPVIMVRKTEESLRVIPQGTVLRFFQKAHKAALKSNAGLFAWSYSADKLFIFESSQRDLAPSSLASQIDSRSVENIVALTANIRDSKEATTRRHVTSDYRLLCIRESHRLLGLPYNDFCVCVCLALVDPVLVFVGRTSNVLSELLMMSLNALISFMRSSRWLEQA
ncbi:hypothetical protein EVAR_73025_1 [Eumeta japonica]|uniref:Uncharacterized protein n=1 Tax=Eumeta variegata TaxID=151549 RepID=A0A4C1T3B0_EUMVA|nr:hypothetical protein EVAR_73025_1 [Eumeta japonica]